MKKPMFQGVFFLAFLAAQAASLQTARAQSYTPPPHFDHIVIIVQENRTPDTLFGDGPAANPVTGTPICAGQNGWAANIDLQNGGANSFTGTCTNLQQETILQVGGGSHSNKDWQGQYDNGAMDGACNPQDSGANCGANKSLLYPPYIYVTKGTPANPGVMVPYFQIARTYGWANYMFQTNEGPATLRTNSYSAVRRRRCGRPTCTPTTLSRTTLRS